MHLAVNGQLRRLCVAVLVLALIIPLVIDVLITGLTGNLPSGWSGYVAFFVLLIVLGSAWNSFINPFVYLLPVSVYLLPGLFFLADKQEFFRYKEGWILFFSLFSIWCGFSLKRTDGNSGEIKQESISVLSWILLAFSSTILILILQLAILYGGHFGKAAGLIFKDVALIVLYGALLALAFRSRLYFHVAYLFYLCSLVVATLFAADISRFGFLRAGVIYFVAASIWLKNGLRPISLVSLVFGTFLVLAVLLSSGGDFLLAFGGDVLIPSYVHDVIMWLDEDASLKNQPLMPFFNAGLVLVPDQLWLVEKPKMFNPSAWYLANILDIDPSVYPWGIGLGGVGAAYLYGGTVAIFLIYFAYGVFIYSVLSKVRTGFDLGVYLYFVTLLPFAAYRMDETFIFGIAFVVVPVTYLLLARKRSFLKETRLCEA